MSWSEIVNHESAQERFRRSLQRNRLASTYLFVGPEGIGKRRFAIKLAQALLCETNPETELNPCGTCPGCQQVIAGTHPDMILVSKPADKSIIPVETFIGRQEHRRQEGLCHDIGLKPFRGGRKIAIIDDADCLNQEGANSLLKTLEEPPPKSLLILIGTSEQRQLPTIVSRSQVVRFEPLTHAQVRSILQDGNLIEDPEIPLDELASASNGSVATALSLSDAETMEFCRQLHRQLASRDPGRDDFSRTVIGFVDAAGKDSAKKRSRLELIGDLAIRFYRQWMIQVVDADSDPERINAGLESAVEPAIASWQSNVNEGADVAAACIERCTDMQRQVRANASPVNVVETWLRDLGRIARREFSTG